MANKNGHDDQPPKDGQNDGKTDSSRADSKVTRFPDARERAELERRLKAANDAVPPAREQMINLPPVIKGLCLILIAIQTAMWLAPETASNAVIENFGFFVLRYTGEMPFGWQGLAAPVTHMFPHGGWLHLAVNVLSLVAFGAGLERKLGWKKLSVLYFATGIIGAFTHTALYVASKAAGHSDWFPHPDVPLIGASGGISGLVGAALILIGVRARMGRAWGAMILLLVFFSAATGYLGVPGEANPIAWTVHIGGFLAGLLLYEPLLRSKILR